MHASREECDLAALDETDMVRGHKIENGMRMIENNNDKLVGAWKLVSASNTTSSGERNEPSFGARPVGFLTYGGGRVTALISHGNRKPLTVGGGAHAQEEQAEAYKTFLAYGGRYTFNGDKVIHHVEISSIQNYVGRDLVRDIKFQGDQMTLVTPPTRINGKLQTVELVWQRLPLGS